MKADPTFWKTVRVASLFVVIIAYTIAGAGLFGMVLGILTNG